MLPKRASNEDLVAVASKVLPECNRAAINLVVGYARAQSNWPLTWISNLAEDARIVAQEAGRAEVTFSDIEAAIKQFRTPSDLAQKASLEAAATPQRPPHKRYSAPAPTVAPDTDSGAQGGQAGPRLTRPLALMPDRRGQTALVPA